jgi:hypothetical protein
MAKVKKLEAYGLLPEVENAVVHRACFSPRFYGKVCAVIEPDMITDERAALALKTAHETAKELGHGPERTLIIIQRLRQQVDEGKLKAEQMVAVVDFFEEVEDQAETTEESLISMLRPVLTKMLKRQAGKLVLEEGSTGDMTRAFSLIEKADAIGKVDTTPGSCLSSDSFAEIASLRYIERLSTGITELDYCLSGGMPRGQFWLFAGGFGAGKSMCLTQMAAEGVFNGRAVLYATLELPEPLQKARLIGNLTGEYVDDIIIGKQEAAIARYNELKPRLGPIIFKYFPPGATDVQAIIDWTKLAQEYLKVEVELVCIDYLDKLHHPKAKNEYTAGTLISDALLAWANDSKKWVVTAAQLTRMTDKRRKRKADGDDISDSLGKSRACDGLITINPEIDDESKMVTALSFYIAKYRTGAPNMSTPSLPTDFAHGRVVAINREFKPLADEHGGEDR